MQFWQYAVYYGEAAARLYYGAWSPPEGTKPPEGYIIPDGVTTTTAEPQTEASKESSNQDKSTTVVQNEATTGDATVTDGQVGVIYIYYSPHIYL